MLQIVRDEKKKLTKAIDINQSIKNRVEIVK